MIPYACRLISSVDNMTEPHRFASIIACLAGMTRQIVRQTPHFSQGQTFVLPLLISVLPGIDSNDFRKTCMTLEFLHAMLIPITCVDCSSAVHTRNDLSEVKHLESLRSMSIVFARRSKRKFAYRPLNSKISSVSFSIESFECWTPCRSKRLRQ